VPGICTFTGFCVIYDVMTNIWRGEGNLIFFNGISDENSTYWDLLLFVGNFLTLFRRCLLLPSSG
jgi:hypothetical protein